MHLWRGETRVLTFGPLQSPAGRAASEQLLRSGKKTKKKNTLAAYQDTPATEGDSLSCDLLVSSRLLVCLATTTGARANTLTSICSNSLLEEEEEEEGREGYSASSWLLAVNQDIKLGSCDFWRRLMRLELMVVS